MLTKKQKQIQAWIVTGAEIVRAVLWVAVALIAAAVLFFVVQVVGGKADWYTLFDLFGLVFVLFILQIVLRDFPGALRNLQRLRDE